MATNTNTIQQNNNSVDFESKYDDDFNPNPWVVVRRHVKKTVPVTIPSKRQPIKRQWKETLASKQRRILAVAESKLLNSQPKTGRGSPLPYVIYPKTEEKHAQDSSRDDEPIVVVTPSQTAPRKVWQKKETGKPAFKKMCKNISSNSLPPPIRTVTKEEAFSPVQEKSAPVTALPIQEVEAEESKEEERRGSGDVTVHKVRGTNFVVYNAGRLMTVKMKKYKIVQSQLFGVARKHMSDDEVQPIIGFLRNTSEVIEVSLPSTLVEEFGSWWVSQPPGLATYARYRLMVDRVCGKIDFDTPEDEFNTKVYGAYLGFITRANERADMVRRVRGNVLTRFGQGCAAIGLLLAGASSIPVAAATATVAGLEPTGTIAAGLAAFTVGTAIVGLAIKAAMPWMSHDLVSVEPSKPVSSITCTAPPPKQKEDAKLSLTEPIKMPDHVREQAAFPTGISTPGYEPTVFATNQDNTVAALQKRAFAQPATGDRKAFLDWSSKHWEAVICKVFDLHIPTDAEEQDKLVENWLAGSGSSPSVKARIRTAWAAMRADGYDMHTPVPQEDAYEWTRRDVSVKNETLLKDESASPRQIMAAPPQFVAVIAPFVKALTGLISRKLRDAPLVYAPGMSEEELSRMVSEREWDNRANGDFNAYDSNQGPDMGAAEIARFSSYGLPTLGRQLMRANLKVHGGSMQGVKFQAPYCRMSGDPHTTLMNTVWNLLAMSFVYCTERNIHPREMDVLFLAGGDDSQLNYDGPRIDFESRLALIGLPATIKHVDHLNQVQFLSCRLTRTTRGWRFIPMVGKMAAKLAFSVRANPLNASAILRGGALSMAAAMSGSPPGIAIIDTYLRITGGVEAEFGRDEPWKMRPSHTGDPTDETWDDLADQYGWDEKMQDQLETDLSLVTGVGQCLSSGALALLMDIDSSRKDCFVEKPSESDSEDPIVPPTPVQEVPPVSWSLTAEDQNQIAHSTNGNTTTGRYVPISDWAISSEERNRLAHATNGNTSMRGMSSRRLPGIDQEVRRLERNMRRINSGPRTPVMRGVGTARTPARNSQGPRPGMQGAAAAAYATGQLTRKATITRTSVDSCRIVHRELVASLTGSTGFAVPLTMSMNPGIATTFPWLSLQAVGWEKYHFNSLKVCGYTRTGSTTPGSVIIAPDYDAADAVPVSETVASTYWGTAEDAPWKDICMTMDNKRLAGERFIRTGALPANLDIKTYDVGQVFVCTIDGTAVNWQKIWVEYDVTLINPQSPPGGPAGTGTLQGAGTISATAIYGTTPLTTGSFSLTSPGSANTIQVTGLAIGTEYQLSIFVAGTVITGFTPGAQAGFSGKTTLFSGFNAAATAAAEVITIIPAATTITLAMTVTATTITASEVTITALIPAPGF